MAVDIRLTNQPKSLVELRKEQLGEGWSNLSAALYTTYDAALSDREKLDRNLIKWNNAYELLTAPKNWPWPGSSNVVPPIIPTQLDTMLANIVLAVYAIQRFYVVNGNTEQAANTQHDVEQYLNAELFRPRPGSSWLMQHVEGLFAGLRDGVGITAIQWRREYAKQRVAIVERIKDPTTGIDILDPLTFKPIIKTTVEEQTVPVYDDVDLQTVELRDFGVIPAWQTDLDKAAAVWRRVYLDSNELLAMCKSTDNPDGPLERKAVEFAVNSVPPGESEIKYSRQGYSTYTIAGQIQIGQEEGFANPELRQHRGPLEVIVLNSKQFFDGKEHVFYLHPLTETCLGYQRYQYWHGQRPYSVKKPFPRVKRFYGFSLVERLLPSLVELAGNRNRRNDALDQRTLPPSFQVDGVKIIKAPAGSWGPDVQYKVPTGKGDIGFFDMPSVDHLVAGENEENIIRRDIEEFTGNSAPMLGGQSSGRPTAKGIQAQIARASIRHNFVAMHVRDADSRTLWQIVQLKLQYGPDINVSDTNLNGQPQRLTIPKDVLAQDYTYSIAGSGGPLDKASRAQEMQALYALLMENPLVNQSPVRIWGVTRMLLEEYSRADILALIGTRDEAEQQAKMQQMMAPLMAAAGGGQQK